MTQRGSGFGQDFPAVVHRDCGEGKSVAGPGSGAAPASGQFEPGAVEGGSDLRAGHGAGRRQRQQRLAVRLQIHPDGMHPELRD